MSESGISGTCLCGAVTFELRPPFQKMVHCHCSRCRKSSGTGHATNLIAAPDRITWLGGIDCIVRYEHRDARSFGKWFCRHCGSPLPRLTRSGKLLVIPAGALDGELPVQATDHIFWASRAAWSCASDGLPTHETYPASW